MRTPISVRQSRADTDHFESLRAVAELRGERDFERGLDRDDNPHRGNCATDEAEYWLIGWQRAFDRRVDGALG